MDLQVGVNKGTILNFPRDDQRVDRAVDGPIVCTTTPDGVVSLVPSPDGKTCDVIPVGAGTAIYNTSADADLGPGDKQIAGNPVTIVVTAAAVPQATHIESEEGPVIPQ